MPWPVQVKLGYPDCFHLYIICLKVSQITGVKIMTDTYEVTVVCREVQKWFCWIMLPWSDTTSLFWMSYISQWSSTIPGPGGTKSNSIKINNLIDCNRIRLLYLGCWYFKLTSDGFPSVLLGSLTVTFLAMGLATNEQPGRAVKVFNICECFGRGDCIFWLQGLCSLLLGPDQMSCFLP